MTFGAFATLLVSLAFAGLFYWVLSPRNKARLQSYASIPLDDDESPRAESRRTATIRRDAPLREALCGDDRREEPRP